MRVVTLLNRIEKFKSFVYKKAFLALQQNLCVCLWGNGGGAHDSLRRG